MRDDQPEGRGSGEGSSVGSGGGTGRARVALSANEARRLRIVLSNEIALSTLNALRAMQAVPRPAGPDGEAFAPDPLRPGSAERAIAFQLAVAGREMLMDVLDALDDWEETAVTDGSGFPEEAAILLDARAASLAVELARLAAGASRRDRALLDELGLRIRLAMPDGET